MNTIKRLSVIVFIFIAAMVMSAVAGAEAAVTDFAGLQAAVLAGGDIVLGSDITVTETITVPKDMYVGISGAHKLTAGAGVSPMFTLTAGEVTLNGTNHYVSTGSRLYLNGVTLEGAGNAGTLVNVGKNALLDLENATLTGADVAVDVAVGDAMQSVLQTPDGGTVNVSKKVVIKGGTAGVRIGGLTADGAHKFRNATIDWKAASGVKSFKAAPNLLIVYGDTEGTSIGFTVTNRDDKQHPANFFARSLGDSWDVGEAKKCLIPDEKTDVDTPILRTEAIYTNDLAGQLPAYLAFPKKGADGDFIVYGNNNKDYATSSFYEAVCAATGTLSDDTERKINCQDTTSSNPAYIVMNADGTLPSGKAFVVGAGKVQVVSTIKACTLTLIENLQVGSYVGGESTKGELTFGGDA
ncbi:MAG: hypothetical protein RR150_12380, partial [Clostridia bacterium]